MNFPVAVSAWQITWICVTVLAAISFAWYRQRMRHADPEGWLRLVERYGTEQPPSGKVLKNQTVRIGDVVYRDSTTIGIAEQGLYLQTWRKAVLIPWAEFRGTSRGRLFWEQVSLFSIGDPPITTIAMPESVLSQFRAQLPEKLQSTLGAGL